MNREVKLDWLIRTFMDNWLDIPCSLVCWACFLCVTYRFVIELLAVWVFGLPRCRGLPVSQSGGFPSNCSFVLGGGSVAFEGLG